MTVQGFFVALFYVLLFTVAVRGMMVDPAMWARVSAGLLLLYGIYLVWPDVRGEP